MNPYVLKRAELDRLGASLVNPVVRPWTRPPSMGYSPSTDPEPVVMVAGEVAQSKARTGPTSFLVSPKDGAFSSGISLRLVAITKGATIRSEECVYGKNDVIPAGVRIYVQSKDDVVLVTAFVEGLE